MAMVSWAHARGVQLFPIELGRGRQVWAAEDVETSCISSTFLHCRRGMRRRIPLMNSSYAPVFP